MRSKLILAFGLINLGIFLLIYLLLPLQRPVNGAAAYFFFARQWEVILSIFVPLGVISLGGLLIADTFAKALEK